MPFSTPSFQKVIPPVDNNTFWRRTVFPKTREMLDSVGGICYELREVLIRRGSVI
jgi:hypothetical protein